MNEFSKGPSLMDIETRLSHDQGPYKVSIQKYEFKDASRHNRFVPMKFVYPSDLKNMGKLPLVVWSHGLGGSRDGAGFLARYIASHGYIVANIQHIGTDSSLWEGKPGHPWDNIRKAHISRRDTINRFRDVPFFLNSIENCRNNMCDYSDNLPDLIGHVDFNNIGMSGHSFGAATTQIMAGQKLGKGQRMYSLRDHRFKAAISYSPTMLYNLNERPFDIYGPIAIPMFYMTGTLDSSPVHDWGYEDRLKIYENASGPDQYLMVLEEGDHMVFSGSRGQLGKNDRRESQEQAIRSMALMFWDAYLKQDVAAKEWLATNAGHYLKDQAHFEFRNIR